MGEHQVEYSDDDDDDSADDDDDGNKEVGTTEGYFVTVAGNEIWKPYENKGSDEVEPKKS